MTTEQILFYLISGLAITSSAGVILNVRNTVYAALSLVVSMLSLAVLFIMLNAEFIGVLQIMVCAGAIVVLFLFVIMLLNLKTSGMGGDIQLAIKTIGMLLIAAAGLQLVLILQGSPPIWAEVGEGFGSVRELGRALYTDYVLAFELAGILLLVGIVGAVVLAKQRVEE